MLTGLREKSPLRGAVAGPLLALGLAFALSGCARDYWIMPFASTINVPPTGVEGPALFFESIELGMEPGSRGVLFVHQDESRENLAKALVQVFDSSGFRVVAAGGGDVIHVSATLNSTKSKDGASGSWENAELELAFHRGGELLHTWTIRSKRRGREAPAAFTSAVNACVNRLHKDMTSQAWARAWSQPRATAWQ